MAKKRVRFETKVNPNTGRPMMKDNQTGVIVTSDDLGKGFVQVSPDDPVPREATHRQIKEIRLGAANLDPRWAVNERGITGPQSLAHSFSNDPVLFAEWLSEAKFDNGEPMFSDVSMSQDGRVVVRSPLDGKYRTIDPKPNSIHSFLEDLAFDVMDIAADIGIAGASAAAEGSGMVLSPFVGAAMATAVEGGGETMRQLIGEQAFNPPIAKIDSGQIKAAAAFGGLSVPAGRFATRKMREIGTGISGTGSDLAATAAGLPSRKGFDMGEGVLSVRAQNARRAVDEGGLFGPLARATPTLTEAANKVTDVTGLPLNPRIGELTEFPKLNDAAKRLEDTMDFIKSDRFAKQDINFVEGALKDAADGGQSINLNAIWEMLDVPPGKGAGQGMDTALRIRQDTFVQLLMDTNKVDKKRALQIYKEINSSDQLRKVVLSQVRIDDANRVKRVIQDNAYAQVPTTGATISNTGTAAAVNAARVLRENIENMMGGEGSEFVSKMRQVEAVQGIKRAIGQSIGRSGDPASRSKTIDFLRTLFDPRNTEMLALVNQLDEMVPAARDLPLGETIRRSVIGEFFDPSQVRGGKGEFKLKLSATGAPRGLALAAALGVGGGSLLSGDDWPTALGKASAAAALAFGVGTTGGVTKLVQYGGRLVGDPLSGIGKGVQGVLGPGLGSGAGKAPSVGVGIAGTLPQIPIRALGAEQGEQLNRLIGAAQDEQRRRKFADEEDLPPIAGKVR